MTGVQTCALPILRDTSRYRTLARVLAHLGAVDEALQVVEDRLWANAHQSATHSALLDVAQAAGEARPEGAARIYDRHEPGAWADVFKALYDDELHRLPAARDEFEKAGLL